MEIGFLTNCLRRRALPEIIEWAGANGFTALELAAWVPRPGSIDPSLDAENFDRSRADELNALARQHGIHFTCLTYCENTLDHDPIRRAAIVQHLYRVLDAAHLLGVKTISTFIGRDETRTQTENLETMGSVFAPLLDYAAARDIRIAIENCPMVGWQFEGLPGNLAYSPLLWDELFRRLPHPNLGLNLDPSHLVWLDVDYNDAALKYAKKIFHTHAKDTQRFLDKRTYDSTLPSALGSWWTYRLPGKGEIDWKRWVTTLRSTGYDGVLSIEHEDPEYEHTEELVKQGLLLGKQNLQEAISRA